MEILAESTLWGEFIFFLVIAIIFTLIFGGNCVAAVYEREGVPALLFGFLCVIFSSLIIGAFLAGPNVEYTALITDYNEVFAQGYEIVRQEGSLTVLKKVGGGQYA